MTMKTAKQREKMAERVQHFSIRKLSIGAASVMIGLTLMFMTGQSVSADTTTSDATTAAVTNSQSNSEESGTANANTSSEATTQNNGSETDASTTADANTNSQESSTTAGTSTTTVSEKTKNTETDGTQTAEQKADDQSGSTNETVNSDTSAQSATTETKATNQTTDTSKYNTSDWEGTLNQDTNEYTLTKYKGADKENIYIPNTQDFIDAGTISADDKVYVTKDLLQTITKAGAVNVTIDGAGEKNKVYAKGDLSSAMARSTTLKNVDLSNLDTSEVTNASWMFYHDTALENANLSGWDFSNTSDLSYMFLDDSKLQSLNISNWQLQDNVNTTFTFHYGNNLSSLTDMNIAGVKNLNKDVLTTYLNSVKKSGATTIDLSSTTLSSSVTDLKLAFANLPKVTSINLSGWNTSNITNLYAAFAFDSALTDVNLSGWNLSNTSSLASLFYNDSNLTNVNFNNVDFGQNITNEVYAFQGANKLANVTLTGAQNVPESVLRAFITAAKNSNATTLDLSNVSLSDKITSFKGLFQNMPNLETINLTGLKTSNITDMSYMFDGDFKLKEIIGIGDLDTSNVTNMSHMFSAMENLTDDNNQPKGTIAHGSLTNLDLSKWKTSKVTNMSSMFDGQNNLQTLKGLASWDTANVTNMSRMFAHLKSLADGTFTGVKWDTSNVTDMSYMFYNMPLQKDLSFVNDFKTSKVTDMSYMFAGDTALTELDLSNWDVSSVGTKTDHLNYSLAMMFADDVSLKSVGDISHWNTSNVHSTRSMFYGTTSLTSIDLSGWKTGKLQIAGNMFYGTGARDINLTGWDLSNLTKFNDYGLVDENGTHRGGEGMFANLSNKAVIKLDNVTLPDAKNAFDVTDFRGDKPIVVLANGNSSALAELNKQTWTDETGNTVTGRQNSNILTYVDADDNLLGSHKLNFVYTDAASLQSELAEIVKDDKANFDAQKGATSSIKLLDPAEDDSFLADFMTSKYQLTYKSTGDQGGSTDPDDSGSTVDPSDPADTDHLNPKPENPDQNNSGQSNNGSSDGSTSTGQTMPTGKPVNVKSQDAKKLTKSAAALAKTNKSAATSSKQSANALPQTGAADNNAALWGLGLLSMLALGAFVDRKRRQ
ncbi:MAG: BspA family leucine-rich repeat surface protein [Lactobacillus sp.]|nr:BspA family leucine-rich repeat surface protein [Lactobacillus sp.]MCH3990053.1 BspA family leucine-rich repeat surface protein [Lactobacillus sp.]MCH4069233.1 BspA family leucine-rich repeat surface protein [Lactobacillus sp.]MCI1303535.1 BspA family leucine-rich repeat surface protein [Lactobacillus sp.]MCI1399311.1 BspA family leucine-rich repeat surface protein [Lactobacillus sp.]